MKNYRKLFSVLFLTSLFFVSTHGMNSSLKFGDRVFVPGMGNVIFVSHNRPEVELSRVSSDAKKEIVDNAIYVPEVGWIVTEDFRSQVAGIKKPECVLL